MDRADSPDGVGGSRRVRFALAELGEQVEAFWQRWPDARADEGAVRFVAPGGEGSLTPPYAALRPRAGERIGDYCERLPGVRERQLVLLLRAGAVAFGVWRGGELVQHKAVRKYVVRGRGRAQATHLKTRGKSRYGSRLRLQNWHALLVETNERLRDCVECHGPFDRVFRSVPVRVWSELFAVRPAPPFDRGDPITQRLPLHVHRPDHGELLRVRGWLEHGLLELRS